MYKYLLIIQLLIIGLGCNQKLKNNSEPAKYGSQMMEKTVTLTVEFHSFEVIKGDKFKILALFQKADVQDMWKKNEEIFLYPNYVRLEGKEISMDDPHNQRMTRLKTLKKGDIFSANVILKGSGKNKYGLIMDWQMGTN